MLSDTHYTMLNVGLFQNEKSAVLLLVIMSSTDIAFKDGGSPLDILVGFWPSEWWGDPKPHPL